MTAQAGAGKPVARLPLAIPRLPPRLAARRPAPLEARDVADLGAMAGVAVLAALGAAALPGAHPVRLVLAAAAVFLVPGYLLLEAALPAATRRERAWRALLALGVSPAVVGLTALATALLPEGFRAGNIIAAVTLLSLGLAAVALVRRAARPAPTADPGPDGGELLRALRATPRRDD